MEIALYQPEIAQNAGTLIRLSACLAAKIHIIEPCGFIMNDRKMKRSGMDYLEKVEISHHRNYQFFMEATKSQRKILLSPRAPYAYTDFLFEANDILLCGRESDGVPEDVRGSCDQAVFIPMVSDCRSLNVAVAAAMVLGEALRQTKLFPGGHR